MAITVNIKSKAGNFKGAPLQWNVVLNGPREVFTPSLARFLHLQGLSEWNKGDPDHAIWTTKPASVAPPFYLADALATRYGVRMTRETQKMVSEARDAVPEPEGLDKFVSRSRAPSAGAQALRVRAGSEMFIANCDESNVGRRNYLEGAGWLAMEQTSQAIRERFGSMPYVTGDPFIAGNLEHRMDAGAVGILNRRLGAAMRLLKDSRSHKAPENFAVPAPEGLDYLEFQKVGIQTYIDHGKSGFLADDMGLGKAQPLDAKILTPDGWRRMGDMAVGDLVIGSSGLPTRVTGVYPQGLKQIFRVGFSDGSSTECCDEHLWSVNTPVRKRRGAKMRALTLSEIRADLVDAAGNRKHYIPLVSPVAFASKDLPINPYLLGVLLGDGSTKYHYTRFSSIDDEIIDAVREAIPGDLAVKYQSGCDYSIVSKHAGAPNAVRRALDSMGLAGKGSDNKFIPEIYLTASISQRTDLLQGLLDTDGYVAKDGTIQFSSNSIVLAKGVGDLVMSLGGCARFTVKTSASGKPHHLVTIVLPDDVAPFRLARKLERHKPRVKYQPCRGIASVTPVGTKLAQCISVEAEDHLYVTDDYILTHNTVQGIGVLNGRPEVRNMLVSCQANMRLKWVREIEKWKINPDLTVGHAEGDFFPDTDIVVINYDIVDRHKAKLHGRKWDLVLGDEGQNLKNPEAKRTIAMLGDVVNVSPDLRAVPLAKNGQLLILSGTPKPNKIADLWPLLTSTRPDIWGKGPEAHRAFLNRYQPPVLIRKKMRKGNREWEVTIPLPGEPIREMELQLRMRGSGSFVRRMKRDTDLPPKFRTPIELPFKLSKADRDALAEIDADIEALAERLVVSRGGARVGRSELASSVIDTISGLAPGSPDFTEGARVRANLGRLKAPYMAKFITDELNDDKDSFDGELRKTVIFAHHKDVIQVMAAKIRETYPNGVLVYDGSISSAKKKQDQVDRFESDPEARVFLMSLSGASGITLTASHRMRIAEPDWNPANMSQIEDRIWRIGQMKNCDIGYLFVPDSHDINMGLTLIKKMETDEKAINTFSFPASVRNAGKALPAYEPPPGDLFSPATTAF